MTTVSRIESPVRGRFLLSTGSRFEKEIGYARAVVQDTSDGRWAYLAGATGFDYAAMTLPEDVGAQTANTIATIEKVLAAAELALSDVIRVTYILTDRADLPVVIPHLKAAFGAAMPAATMLQAGLATEEMKVEIEVDAFRPTAGR